MNKRFANLIFLFLIVLSTACNQKETDELLNTYTVTFNTNGGPEIEDQDIIGGNKLEEPTSPEKTGHEFINWLKGDEIYNFETPVTEDFELQATWEKVEITYTATFSFNNGKEDSTALVIEDSLLILPPTPLKDGYVFKEWQLEGDTYDFKTPVKKDVTLTVLWEKLHTITFNFDNGLKDSVITIENNSLVVLPQVPLKDGYLFKEWQYNGTAYDFSTKITADKTLKAIYDEVIDQFVVTFDKQNGEQNVALVVDENTPVTEPTPPTYDGHQFLGWTENGIDLFDFNTPIVKATTLTATWKVVIEAGETTVNYASISRTDFENWTEGEHKLVKATVNYLGRGWAWGTEVYIVDPDNNSSKDFYSHSNYGMFTFPNKFNKGDATDGSSFIFNLVKGVYMSSPQVGFAYLSDDTTPNGDKAYDGSKWNAPMVYGIEYFDEVVRGNIKEVTYSDVDGFQLLVGNDVRITFPNLTANDVATYEAMIGENKFIYTTIENGIHKSINDHNGDAQIFNQLIIQ
ncbi:InlB B-repeat-containing protein [Flammeovirga kamogawensis]|uniref:InlB B-repeat-containing protein n=1 Tax=Flammeovirga kamogawensis TaxID=373891 RepID=A0ABX8H0H8_9BACT|nr:InlB B-repeat-containing protein [Flammeovirga kamogawensis]MBB6462211.1 hypothetical protein [Flammeovirga kamogawensis]QWG09388.1 InlB B-repeat-containing protein [Flammeovirga kamogawensis]TRX64906.1 InlB B-repeat-containing protein [Flammeovirga kamogawensis]